MSKVRMEKRQVARLRELWDQSGRAFIESRPKMMVSDRTDCKRKFDEIGQQLFTELLEQIEVIDDVIEPSSIQYESEDSDLAARVETLHRQLGEVVARVTKQRREAPDAIKEQIKKSIDEAHPKLEPMPDERPQASADSEAANAVTNAVNSGGLERQLRQLDSVLGALQRQLPPTVDRATRLAQVAKQPASAKKKKT